MPPGSGHNGAGKGGKKKGEFKGLRTDETTASLLWTRNVSGYRSQLFEQRQHFRNMLLYLLGGAPPGVFLKGGGDYSTVYPKQFVPFKTEWNLRTLPIPAA